jgi:L-amino acid N-acyltransferase YncA
MNAMNRNEIQFEELGNKHLAEITEIYNYYILNSTATFHGRRLSVDEMKELVLFDDPKYKTYIVLQDNILCGYVILSQYKKREAYNDTAEITIYLKPDLTGKGIGSIVMNFIEGIAKKLNLHVLVATISGENSKSIKLVEKNGYFKCAHYKEVGRKFGKLLDVVAYQKILGSYVT